MRRSSGRALRSSITSGLPLPARLSNAPLRWASRIRCSASRSINPTAPVGWRVRLIGMVSLRVPVVQIVQPLRSVQTLTSFLPRDAGEDEGGGLNDLNGLNVLNEQQEDLDDE